MKFIISILLLPFTLLKFLNPFYYLKMFIKWTFIIVMVGGLTYNYVLGDSQKDDVKSKVKTEASNVVGDVEDKVESKARELVDTLSDKAFKYFDEIRKEPLTLDKTNIEYESFEEDNILKMTEEKIQEVASRYTYKEVLEMGEDAFQQLVIKEVNDELKRKL